MSMRETANFCNEEVHIEEESASRVFGAAAEPVSKIGGYSELQSVNRREQMTGRILSKGALMLATGAFLMASVMTMASPVHAATLHRTGGSPAGAPTDPPGDEISVYYDIGANTFSAGPYSGTTSEPAFGTAPVGADNFVTLINPASATLCAMIYVTDNSEELGACCGCPLTAQGSEGDPGLDRFSVKSQLVNNWAVPFGGSENATGTIIVFAATPTGTTLGGGATCDPTGGFAEGSGGSGSLTSPFAITGGLGLNGWILHLNSIAASAGTTTSVTEASFWDDGSGDPAEASTLEAACGFIFTHDSGAGHCTCPAETL